MLLRLYFFTAAQIAQVAQSMLFKWNALEVDSNINDTSEHNLLITLPSACHNSCVIDK